MTAVKASHVERAVKDRRPDVTLLLFYGPDTGLVAERARGAARAFVDDPEDAFQLIRLDGDALADQPSRLIEEATTFGLFGDKRAIWIRPTSRQIASAVAACLDVALSQTLVVVEAGDLAKTSPLRVACERSPRALALPCYADETRDLGGLVTEMLQAEGLAIESDAREILIESLGGDRLATRREVEKLALYALGRERVHVEDVEAVVSDVSGASVDDAIDAAFAGDLAELEAGLGRLSSAGTAPAALMAIALRHTLSLLAARARLDDGQDLDTALRTWRGMRFSRRERIARQVQRWTVERLSAVLVRLQTASLATRQSAGLAEALASDALMRIAARAS